MHLGVSMLALMLGISALNAEDMNEGSAMNYLKKYHYMGEESPIAEISEMPDEEGYVMGLTMFQSMHGLDVTGVLDEATKELMSLPRCGNPDVMPDENMRRKKRYSAQGGKWPKTSLTYKITKYTPDMSRSDVDMEIRRAFDVWEMVTPLRFTEVPSNQNADIVILFGAYSHGDQFPFDGPGSTLAHAFFPQYGGDAHFDESETWTLNTYNGINLFQVAAHEFGHALGLGHSSIDAALMAPFYRGYVPNFELHQDDIDGIQSLYGPPITNPDPTTTTKRTTTTRRTNGATNPPSTTKPTTTTVQPGFVDFCRDPAFDAITKHETADGVVRTYVFRNDYYAELDSDGVVAGYPRKISDDWQGLPNNLDAALYWEAVYRSYWSYDYSARQWQMRKEETVPSRTYFFKGNRYWRFRKGSMDAGYPKGISIWGGLPSNLDAAFVWTGNGKSYFMKGNQYYRYNNQTGRIDRGYPRPITVWSDEFSGGVDTAFKSGSRTYFFKGEKYYRYNDRTFDVDQGYPRDNYLDLLGCNRIQSALESETDDTINGSNSIHTLSIMLHTVVLTFMSVLLCL